MSEKSSAETVLVFLLGAAIGATMGILFAPKSGKETRQKIKTLMEDMEDKTQDWIDEGKEKAEGFIAKAKEKILPIKNN
ncbi:MAG: hypothetical protein A2252_08570 [Elusimicrobia bacterium RIFOXYA2_FULL_39_19]|nr:MAG: hypothetical protein A2252_08570 [Elusimicrobia bacterium RIFOXYA2_FULL_39_19]